GGHLPPRLVAGGQERDGRHRWSGDGLKTISGRAHYTTWARPLAREEAKMHDIELVIVDPDTGEVIDIGTLADRELDELHLYLSVMEREYRRLQQMVWNYLLQSAALTLHDRQAQVQRV